MGVKDSGEIVGVNNNVAPNLLKAIINTVNNPELFTSRTAVYPEIVIVDEKVVIYVYVHSSPSVHQYKKNSMIEMEMQILMLHKTSDF